jgi:hypothetical protein
VGDSAPNIVASDLFRLLRFGLPVGREMCDEERVQMGLVWFAKQSVNRLEQESGRGSDYSA